MMAAVAAHEPEAAGELEAADELAEADAVSGSRSRRL
jgi:hypothetical protein